MTRSRMISALTILVIGLAAMSFFQNITAIQANSIQTITDRSEKNVPLYSQGAAATPTPTPTAVAQEFTEQELAEGQPIGIIIGAAAIVVVIFLGTFILLRRQIKQK